MQMNIKILALVDVFSSRAWKFNNEVMGQKTWSEVNKVTTRVDGLISNACINNRLGFMNEFFVTLFDTRLFHAFLPRPYTLRFLSTSGRHLATFESARGSDLWCRLWSNHD
jgi:hypothetical protein